MSRRSRQAPPLTPPVVPTRSSPGRKWLLAILLVAASLAVYAPTWWYGTLSIDDPTYVDRKSSRHNGTDFAERRLEFHVVLRRQLDSPHVAVADARRRPLRRTPQRLPHYEHALARGRSRAALLGVGPSHGRELRSAFVAALFALHPLHVESVAWIAERKDVLSIFFGMISLLAYVRYATGAGRMNLVAAWIGLALSLMAKQTLVTLPFVFLLLDYWPLGRWRAHSPPRRTRWRENIRFAPRIPLRWAASFWRSFRSSRSP